MAVISTFSAIEHIEGLLVIRIAKRDPEIAFTLYNALSGDGPKGVVRMALVDKYVEKADRASFHRMMDSQEVCRKRRNLIAHCLWFCVPTHPEYLVLVDPRRLAADIARQKSHVQVTMPDPISGHVKPPKSHAARNGLLLNSQDLTAWKETNRDLYRAWGILLTLVEEPTPESRTHLRERLATQLGKIEQATQCPSP